MTTYRYTHAQFERVVASLRGLRITEVHYAMLAGAHDRLDTFDWDRGASHEPAIGIQLTTDVGAAFTIIWGSSLGYACMEAHDRTINSFLTRIGEPSGPTILPVGHHPRWRRFLGREITDCTVAWWDWVSGDPTTNWIRIEFAAVGGSGNEPETIWITAGRWAQDSFQHFAQDLTVFFDREEAVRAKITV